MTTDLAALLVIVGTMLVLSGCVCVPLIREYEADLDACLRAYPRASEAEACVEQVREDWESTFRREGCQ